MGRIRDVLQGKGATVHSINASSTVFEAIARMVELNIGSLVVIDDEQGVCGIITERDYLRKIAVLNRSSRFTTVREIMTSPIECVGLDMTVEQGLAMITDRRHRHLPVTHQGQLVGLVSVGDLVKYLVEEQRVEIRHLTDYVSASYPL